MTSYKIKYIYFTLTLFLLLITGCATLKGIPQDKYQCNNNDTPLVVFPKDTSLNYEKYNKVISELLSKTENYFPNDTVTCLFRKTADSLRTKSIKRSKHEACKIIAGFSFIETALGCGMMLAGDSKINLREGLQFTGINIAIGGILGITILEIMGGPKSIYSSAIERESLKTLVEKYNNYTETIRTKTEE